MPRRFLVLVLIVATTTGFGLTTTSAQIEPVDPSGPIDPASAARLGPTTGYAVHEWGTFTSVSGSDGTLLPGLHVEEEALPDFVFSHAGMGTIGGKGWKRPVRNVTIKMETPVLYFYSDAPRRARVEVDFRGGSISQWYPSRTGGEVPPEPAVTDRGVSGGDIDFAEGWQGSIRWDVDVLPPGDHPAWLSFRGPETLAWIQPRRTSANLLRTDSGLHEKYLFYRGLGNFELPVRFEVADGRLSVTNHGSERIPFLVVFRHETAGSNGPPVGMSGVQPRSAAAFVTLDGLDAGESTEVALADLEPTDSWQPRLYESFWHGLTSAGLYGDEADAMLQTWWRSYFDADGLRVFWVVPDGFTDQILPLRIDPQPEELERVLVGRSEVLTPGFEHEMVTRLKRNPLAWDGDRFGEAYRARAAAIANAE